MRVPMEISCATGLAEGEKVAVEIQDGDIVVRRRESGLRSGQDAEAAAEEIIAESNRHSPGSVSLRELLAAGRRA